MTSQYYVECPRPIRTNLTFLVIFNCVPADWLKIKKEILFINKDHDDYILGRFN